jgi:hypothetical protein
MRVVSDDDYVEPIEFSDSSLAGQPFLSDRRASDRFPLNQEMQYRVVDGRGVRPAGQGRTLNMSSGGICFSTAEELPLGRMVEVAVNWPARLENCLLKFVASGRVVRTGKDSAVVRIERYEFRTRSSKAMTGGPPLS